MHYLSVTNLTKTYGARSLFENISFHISEGDKIALVAKNGSGKSTLLKILAGQDTAESGTVWRHKDVTIALTQQDPKFIETATVLDNIFHADHPVINVIKEYERVSDMPEEQQDYVAIQNAIEKMDEAGAWDFDVKVKQILGKLNIHHLDKPVGVLSGGQRKRVALAQTLIDIGFEHRHVLLIMDEPTNHLDVEMVEWLEHYLSQENVTLLLVTHDRYFLDAVCEEIWELDGNDLFVYKGDYQNYLEKKTARLESTQTSIDKSRQEFKKELEWMRKQPKARTTKSRSREQNFYEIEKASKQKIDESQVSLSMKMNRLGGKVAELKKVYKAYGELQILRGFDYTFVRGERIGIVGKNGAGKSTFLEMLLGNEKADSGKINIGETIIFGHFSQQGLEWKEDMRVIEFVKNIAENFPLADGSSLSAAQFLQLFLFTPDQQYTYLSKLSGGEKKRLQLLSVLFRNPNFLILDEPTNDLDLPTLSVLENFLSEYGGCLLIVSHDRYFMDRLVDHLFVFEGEGKVRDFPGNYSQYRTWLTEEEKKKKAANNPNAANLSTPAMTKGPQPSDITAPAIKTKKLSFKEQREMELIEETLPKLEEEKNKIALKMATSLPYEEMQQLITRVTSITKEQEEKELRWMELSEMGS